MTDIVDAISNIISDLIAKPQFLYGTSGWLNILADKEASPLALLSETNADGIIRQGGSVQRTYNVQIFFCENSKHDDKPDQSKEKINRQRNICQEFMNRYNAAIDTTGTKIFKPITNFNELDAINPPRIDRYVTGVILTFRSEPLNSDSICVS